MIAEIILLAAVPAILGPAISGFAKKLLSQRKERDIEVKLESGERVHLKIDPNATEEQIRNLVAHDEKVKKAAMAGPGA